MANSSIAAMTEDLAAMRRDHELERTVLNNGLEEARKSHLYVSAKLLDLQGAACPVEDPVDTPVRPSPAPYLSTIESDSADEAAESTTPTPSPHVSDADDDSNSEVEDGASASEPDALTQIEAFMHRMAHNKELGESSEDEPGLTPVELLASGGAKSAQLGAKQRDLLSERAREQSAAVEENARREHAATPGAAAAGARFDVKAAFRVQSQPATMEFSSVGTPDAATEPPPGGLRSARAMAPGVASATLSLGKSLLQSGSGGATTASQLSAGMDGGMSLGSDFVDESPEEASGGPATPSRSSEAPTTTRSVSKRATRKRPLLPCLSLGDDGHFEDRPEPPQVDSDPELAGASDDDDDDVAVSAEQSFLERQTKAVEKTATAATNSAAVEGERLRMEAEALDLKRAQALGCGSCRRT